jgi:YqxM protein
MKRLRPTRLLKKKGILYLKLVAAFYLSFSIVTYLSSTTNASFNDVEEVNTLLSVGTWETEDPPEDERGCTENHEGWDCSSLEFVSSGYEKLDNGLIRVYANIKNNSENDMKMEGKAFLFYSAKGNPKNGEKLGSQITFDPIPARETVTIEYIEASLKGKYKFVAYQAEGHPGQGELWSDDITVTEVGETETPPQKENSSNDEVNEKEQPVQDKTNNDKEKGKKEINTKEDNDKPTEETIVENPPADEKSEDEPINNDPNPEKEEGTVVPPSENLDVPDATPSPNSESSEENSNSSP